MKKSVFYFSFIFGTVGLELHQYSCVDEAACEVVGYGIVVVVDVLYPIVGVYIVDAQDVECVNTKPHVLEPAAYAGAVVAFFVVEQTVGHANVHTTVGRGVEDMAFAAAVGRAKG